MYLLDGDCGYTALGISRQELVRVLDCYLQKRMSPEDPIRIELQWQLDNMLANDREVLIALGGVTIDNYVRHFIAQNASDFQSNQVIAQHNAPGTINRWVNYLDLGDGIIPDFREEQHGLGVIIATLLNRQIIVHVQGARGIYTETFNPIPDVIIEEPIGTTRSGSGPIDLFIREGEAHFDILRRMDDE